MIKKLLIVVVIACASLMAMAEEQDVRKSRFTWGAEIIGNVDISSHDMSAVGIDAQFGLESNWIRFLGVSAGAEVMVSNSSRAFPLAVIFRTDFSPRRQLVFMDLRAGTTLNYPVNLSQNSNGYLSAGIGVTLATGKTFSSHAILAYSYYGQDQCYNGNYLRNCPGYSYVSVRLGVQF